MRLNMKFLILFSILSSATFLGLTVKAQDEFSTSSYSGDSLLGNSAWRVSYFNLTTADMPYVNRGGASWYLYQYLSIKYQFSKNEVFSMRPTFSTTTPGVYDNFGNTRPMKNELGDFHFTYSNYQIAEFPGYWDLSGTFYVYLPTSESAQNKKWATRLKSWMRLYHNINRDWTFIYNAKPEYFLHTQKAYRNERVNTAPNGQTFTSVKADNNKIGTYDHYLELRRYVNKTFEPGFQLGWVYDWYHDSNEANSKPTVVETFKAGPNTWIDVNKSLRFLVGFDTEVDIRNPKGGKFNPFDEETNSYYIMTFWNLN